MGVMERCLRLMFPRGRPWALAGDADPLVRGIAITLERPRAAARAIVAESLPLEATESLPEWCEDLGLAYDPTLPQADTRARVDATLCALGDITLNALQVQIDRELYGVIVSEVSSDSGAGADECGVARCGAVAGDYSDRYYDVDGTVLTEEQLARLTLILQHFAPLHLEACVIVGVTGLNSTSEAGAAVCGLEQTGSNGT